MNHFVSVWLDLTRFESDWVILLHFDSFESVWLSLTQFDLIWLNLTHWFNLSQVQSVSSFGLKLTRLTHLKKIENLCFSFPDSVDVCKLSSQILCGKTSWKFVGLDVFDFRPTIGIDDVLPWFCRGTLRKWTHHYFWNNVMILLNKINVLKIIIILKQFGRVWFLIDHSLRPPIDFLYSGVRIALWCMYKLREFWTQFCVWLKRHKAL